jgi:hypothetical protein
VRYFVTAMKKLTNTGKDVPLCDSSKSYWKSLLMEKDKKNQKE